MTDLERAELWRELRSTIALVERELRIRQMTPAITELARGIQGLCGVVRALLEQHGPELDAGGTPVPLGTVVPIDKGSRT